MKVQAGKETYSFTVFNQTHTKEHVIFYNATFFNVPMTYFLNGFSDLNRIYTEMYRKSSPKVNSFINANRNEKGTVLFKTNSGILINYRFSSFQIKMTVFQSCELTPIF